MKLGYSELRDRIAGCWQGKNAGGALGAPLECKRGKVNVEWYLQPDIERNPPPNDDLDCLAVRRRGIRLGRFGKRSRRLLADLRHAELVGVRHRQVQSSPRYRSSALGARGQLLQG